MNPRERMDDAQALGVALRGPVAVARESATPTEVDVIGQAVTAWRDRNNTAYDAFVATRAASDATLRDDIAGVSKPRTESGWSLDALSGEWVRTTVIDDVSAMASVRAVTV